MAAHENDDDDLLDRTSEYFVPSNEYGDTIFGDLFDAEPFIWSSRNRSQTESTLFDASDSFLKFDPSDIDIYHELSDSYSLAPYDTSKLNAPYNIHELFEEDDSPAATPAEIIVLAQPQKMLKKSCKSKSPNKKCQTKSESKVELASEQRESAIREAVGKLRYYSNSGPILRFLKKNRNLQGGVLRDIDMSDISYDENARRVELKADILKICKKIMPFLSDIKRVREVLASQTARDKIIVALNYFFRVRFSERDIDFLEDCYRKMDLNTCHYLSAITELYSAFKLFREVPMNPVGSKRTFASLNEERDANEEGDPEDIRPLLKSGTHQLEQTTVKLQNKVTSKNAELLENLIAKLQETKVALDESIVSTSSSS